MVTTYPIRITPESWDLVLKACDKFEITSKKNVVSILIKAGAEAKGIKLDGGKKN